jgi:NADH-quinone oxidoreductase subunit E
MSEMDKKSLLLSELHAAQREHGWLSAGVIDEIARRLGLHPAEVTETASFYSLFNLKPVGRNQIRLCTNVACCLHGADELLKQCCERLGILPGETTADGKVSVFEEECLGACATAPVVMANGEYFEKLDIVKLDQILEKFR